MSQRTRIESVHVEGMPFLGYDKWGGPVHSDDPDRVMRWLCHGWRHRFNELRSRRMRYADPDHMLLEPIGEDVDARRTSECREDHPWTACVPDTILDSTLKEERTEWNAAIKRRQTLREKGTDPGAMPGFKRKGRDLTFVCWHRKGRNARFRKLNRKHGEVTITGQIPPKHRLPGEPARFRIVIRVRLSQPIRDYTSVRVNWTKRELVFTNQPLPIERGRTGACVGLDGGAVHELADSDGGFHDLPIGKLKRIDRRVRNLQRQQAKRRGKAGLPNAKDYFEHGASNRYLKTERKIKDLQARAARITIDSQHKTTTSLVKDNDIIVVEALQVGNMTRKARPKPDPLHPGQYLPNGAKAKRGLNRVMRRASLGRLYDMLEYKTRLARVAYITVNPAYTSQTCCRCGSVRKENRENQAVFHCKRCGHRANADVNAAINILNRGLETQTAGTRAGVEEHRIPDETTRPARDSSRETRTNRPRGNTP